MKLKEIVKAEMQKHLWYDAQYLIDRIRPYRYVSFDVFDTLIKRSTVTPDGVFNLLGQDFHDSTFREKRIQAEIEARGKTAVQEREEICIEEIYACLPAPYCDDTKRWIDLELEKELSVCYCNQTLKEVFDWCRKEGKHILIISDMYIPESVLIALLEKCGYCGYEAIYLSSKVGVKKRTGHLYSYVLSNIGINGSEVIHIGDTFQSDFIMARRAGMGAILLARNNRGLTKFCSGRGIEKAERVAYSELVTFMQNHISSSWDDYFQFGYEVLGPLLYGFSKWLYENVTAKGIKKIFFFSRDGYIMQKAFRELYGDVVRNQYFYASRRSLRVPQLWLHPELEDVVKSFPNVSMLSIRAFFRNLGLEFEDFSKVAAKYGYQADDKIMRKAIVSDARLQGIYSEIRGQFVANSKREYELLLQYMRQEELEGKVAVVDIGWRGSLQYYLSNIVDNADINLQMYGYYIGLSREIRPGINAHGFIDDAHEGKMKIAWKGSVGLVEFLFVSREGSCQKYEKEGSKIQPRLYEYEYDDITGVRSREADIALKIQDGALQFVHDAASVDCNFDYNRAITYVNLRNACFHPSVYMCNLFGDIRFLEEKVAYLAKPGSICSYFVNFDKFKKDFYYSKWKIGFLKRMVKFPLPYKAIYELAKELEK